MKNWKKQLNDEFDGTVPALKEEIKNAPITVVSENNASERPARSAKIKRRIGIGSAFAAASLAVVFALLGVLGVFAPQPAFDSFVYMLEINPAVAFVTDSDGIVKGVNALNGDADIVLSDENSAGKLKNVGLAEAVVIYTDTAAKLGYLDISEIGDAVRLSGIDDTDSKRLSSAADLLRDYFRKKGIYAVVVEDTVSVAELCSRVGIDASNLTELSIKLQDLPLRYGERVDSSASPDDLKSLYESYAIGMQMLELVRGELSDNIANVVKNARMLFNIGSLNTSIMTHDDNPSKLMKDYWSVKRLGGIAYTEEFSALMDDMRATLAEYEVAFGRSIDSVFDLMTASDAYSAFSGVDLEQVISSLTSDEFLSSPTKFIGMLKNIGCDTSDIEALLNIPQTVSDYLEMTRVANAMLYDKRIERYIHVYEQERAEISADSYADFVKEIESRYGSLDNYWNNR